MFRNAKQKGGDYRFGYDKLYGRMAEKSFTKEKFAKALGISRSTLYHKLNGNVEFTQNEMLTALSILDINPKDINQYFFNQKG